MRKRFVGLATILLLGVFPGPALAQTPSASSLVGQLDAAIQKVSARDASGALASVDSADKTFDTLEKDLERQNLRAERQIEDAIDASKSALSAAAPNFAAAASQLQAARTAAATFQQPAMLPKTGSGSGTVLWPIVGLMAAGLAGLALAGWHTLFVRRAGQRELRG